MGGGGEFGSYLLNEDKVAGEHFSKRRVWVRCFSGSDSLNWEDTYGGESLQGGCVFWED